jgi:predicted  nucleic acid-binding Zn-ribbon protein
MEIIASVLMASCVLVALAVLVVLRRQGARVAVQAAAASEQAQARSMEFAKLIEQTSSMIAAASKPAPASPSPDLAQAVERLESELARMATPGKPQTAEASGEAEMASALADALSKAQTAHRSLVAKSARLEAQLQHLRERAQQGQALLVQAHRSVTDAMSRDSVAHALGLTNQALVSEIQDTREARQKAEAKVGDLQMRLRCSRVVLDALAAMDAGQTRQAAVASAVDQVHEQFEEQARELELQALDQDRQYEALQARLQRALRQRQALDDAAVLPG